MSHYAVIGNPIHHSKSPIIHRQFAEQTGQDVLYEAIRVEPSELFNFITSFFAKGGAGLNVTLPHKEAVFALIKNHSERALQARAVNTIFLNNAGELCGDNTDGLGLIRDLQFNLGYNINGKRVLLLGAGGAARGVLGPLLAMKPDSVSIANRTVAKAEQLASEFAQRGNPVAGDIATFAAQQFDLILNGTSMGLANEMPDIEKGMLANNCCCYDMMYKSTDTIFVKWAKEQGVGIAVDGLGMLVEQAAEAFNLWRGVRPDTASVIKQLRL